MAAKQKSKGISALKNGVYKHPNLGLIPNGWEVHRFKDVFEFLQTNSFSRDQMTYGGDGNSIYNIHYGDIHATFNEQVLDFNKHIHQIPVLLDTTEVRSNDNAFLKDGDLIIADASEDYDGVGECIEITGINKRKVLGGLHTITARDLKGKTIQGFRAYLLKNQRVFINLKKLATGSKVYGVSKGNVAELELVVPPIPEQQKIARILSTWDKAIEKTEQLIDQKQQLKKGLMQQLLTGKVRFKEFVKSKKMKKTKLGMIPGDWAFVEFSEVVDLSHSKFNPINSDEDLKCIELEHLEQNTGNVIGYTNSSNLKSIKNAFKKGDVLFGKLRPYLRKFWLAEFNGVCSSEIWVLSGKKNICSSNYLFYLIQQNSFNQIVNMTSGTKMPRADWELVSEFPFPIPPINEQRMIEGLLSDLTNEIGFLQKRVKFFRMQKNGLMQKLLTGQARVKLK